MREKIKAIKEIIDISNKLRGENKLIVTTNGSFDILHLAHVNLIEKAKKEGDTLIVLINSDDSIRKLKGEEKPIVPENERAEMLAALECVDYVVIFDEDDPLSLLDKIKPHKHVKGGSWDEERIRAEKELLAKWGGEFKNFELEEGYSTTNIIDKIQKIKK